MTKPGLPVPVGESAINPVPLRMIRTELQRLTELDGAPPGFTVIVGVVEGEKLAAETWNPRVGVVGGISIIGTKGIVEPKSSAAYKSSIAMAVRVAAAAPERPVYVTPGYLGERVLQAQSGVSAERVVRAGDHIGFALKHAAVQLLKHDAEPSVVLIGHIGKLAKVAAGMFNTHSQYGDARLETVAALAAACGAAPDVVRSLLGLTLAEAAVPVVRDAGAEAAFGMLAERVHFRCMRRIGLEINLRVVVLTLEDEILAAYRKVAQDVLSECSGGRDVAFVTIGDPGIYSTFAYLAESVREINAGLPIRVLPGASSIQLAASRLGVSLAQGAERFSVLPLPDDVAVLDSIVPLFDTVVLMKIGRRYPELHEYVRSRELLGRTGFVAYAGQDREIVKERLGDSDGDLPGYLSTVIIRP